jgi:hypothetical protein
LERQEEGADILFLFSYVPKFVSSIKFRVQTRTTLGFRSLSPVLSRQGEAVVDRPAGFSIYRRDGRCSISIHADHILAKRVSHHNWITNLQF